MVRVIGIDPGKNYTGISIIETYADGFGLPQDQINLRACFLLEGKGLEFESNIAYQASKIAAIFSDYACDFCVVEKPQIYSRGKSRPNDIIDLAVISGVLAGYSRAMKLKLVTPALWKGQVPKDRHNARMLEKIPGLSDALAKLAKGKHEHIIDSAGLCLWVIEREQ